MKRNPYVIAIVALALFLVVALLSGYVVFPRNYLAAPSAERGGP